MISLLVTYIIPFAIILGVIITVHELGHYWAARAFGVAIDRFSLGFGRAIASRTDKRGVEWRVGWIPLGGYVRFSGDSNDASLPDADELEYLREQIVAKYGPGAEKRYYHFKPVWQRAIVAVAGPVANFLLAIVLIWILVMAQGPHKDHLPRVASVDPGAPAAAAGFKSGDLVLKADSKPMHTAEDLIDYISLRAGERINFQVDRGGQTIALSAVPARKLDENKMIGVSNEVGRIGLRLSVAPADIVEIRYNPVTALGHATQMVGERIGMTVTYLRRVVTGYENGDQLSGVIGMGYVSGKVVSSTPSTLSFEQRAYATVLNMISLMGFVSIGVGFVNLLPIPMLDGGHLVFYAYEAVARRPLAARIQAASYQVGLALVLGLMLFATWNDLQRLRAFQILGGLFS